MATVGKISFNKSRERYTFSYYENGKRISGGSFERKKDAEAARRELQDRLERGIHVGKREAMTFRQVIELPRPKDGVGPCGFLARIEWRCKVGDRMSPTRLAQLKGHVRKHMLPAFGGMKINEITANKIQGWIDNLAEEECDRTGEPYKTSTLGYILADLSMVFDHAISNELGVKTTPFKDRAGKDLVTLPKRSEEPARFLEAVDAAKILYWARTRLRKPDESTHVYKTLPAVILIAMFAGLRRGEICALDWSDLKMNGWVIDVSRNYAYKVGLKSTNRRLVPVNPILHAFLEEYAELMNVDKDGPIVTNYQGNRLKPSSITQDYWPLVCERAGLLDENGERLYRFHDLRHAAGSFWLADDMPLDQVSRLLGHKRIKTTQDIYIHQLEHDRRALDAIQNVSDRFVRLMGAAGVQIPSSERPKLLEAPVHQGTTIEGTVTTTINGVAHVELDLLEPWEREAVEQHRRGATLKRIAAHVGRDQNRVGELLESLGLYKRSLRHGRRSKTADEIENLVERWKSGESTDDIAADAGLAGITIRRYAREAGVTREPLKPGLKKGQGRDVYSHSPELKARAREMWDADIRAIEIAAAVKAEFGVTVCASTVSYWARQGGWRKRGMGWKAPCKMSFLSKLQQKCKQTRCKPHKP
jgi:integrase